MSERRVGEELLWELKKMDAEKKAKDEDLERMNAKLTNPEEDRKKGAKLEEDVARRLGQDKGVERAAKRANFVAENDPEGEQLSAAHEAIQKAEADQALEDQMEIERLLKRFPPEE